MWWIILKRNIHFLMNVSHSDFHWRKQYQEQFRVFFLCSIVKSRIFRKNRKLGFKAGIGSVKLNSSHSRMFHSYVDVTINGEDCKFSPILDPHGYWAVSHLLTYGAFVYIGHLWGPVTFTPVAERLALELSLPFFTT